MTLPVRREPGVPRRWDPVRELDELQERMSQLMSSVFGAPVLADGEHRATWTPLADLSETDDAYLLEVDLPGVKREDIEVETTANELRIGGELKERERTGWLRSRTRRAGHFEYRTTLPHEVDVNKIGAELADGVLTVRVPKSEAVKPRRIQVTGS